MNLSEFSVLDTFVDDNADYSYQYRTTHPKITYDSFDETFCVDIGDGCCAIIYGNNRMVRALELANMIWGKYLVIGNGEK